MRLTRVLKLLAANPLIQTSEKEIVVKAPWGNIAGLTWGNPADPPVLLVHGKLGACSSFRPLVSLLPDSYFYVSFDLPGNGLSDHFPSGRYTSVDFVPSILMIKEHFKWDKFAFIGHSLGALMCKYFILSYPTVVTKAVEIDPFGAYYSWPIQDFPKWYKYYYEQYYGKKYHKWNAGKETAPKYTYKEIEDLMMKSRGLTQEAAAHLLERSLEPAGNGRYRLTYDQRLKIITTLPFTPSHLQSLYTSHDTPIFGILSKQSLEEGLYDKVPFATNPKCWPNNNYKFKIVEGNHDVYIVDPGCMATDIVEFLEDK